MGNELVTRSKLIEYAVYLDFSDMPRAVFSTLTTTILPAYVLLIFLAHTRCAVQSAPKTHTKASSAALLAYLALWEQRLTTLLVLQSKGVAICLPQ